MMDTSKTKKCKCAFCEDELKFDCFEPEFCKPCNIKFITCKKCGESFNKKLGTCPKCEGKK